MTQRNDLLNNKKAFEWLKEEDQVIEFIKEIEIDLLIIGGGHAGTAAARAAIEADETIDVLLAEQQEEVTYRVLGSGEIGHINSQWQASWGIDKVDVEEFMNDWQLRTNNRSNYGLVRKYAMNCGEAFDWIIEVLDEDEKAQLQPMLRVPSPNMPTSLNGFHSYSGTAKMPVAVQDSMMKKNRQLAKDKGVRFLFGSKAYQLIRKEASVVGAILKSKEGYIKVFAKKGVVLAAGDYSRNAQMCRDLLTEAADMIDQDHYWLGQGWKGDGLRLGMLAGGRMESRPHPSMGGNYSFPGFEVIGSTPVLRVNQDGQRYSNEGFGTHVLAATTGAKQANGMLYGVFDSTIFEQITDQTHSYAVLDYCLKDKMDKLKNDLKRSRAAGPKGVPVSVKAGKENPKMPRILYSAKTIEGLADYMYENKVDRQEFLKSVERYNDLCRGGIDEDYGKDGALLHPVEQGPFYAVGQMKNSHRPIGQSYKLLVTTGGLMINDKQEVLDDEYEVLKGLYATGNSSGCRFGFQYSPSLAGASISMAQTLGREVGRYIATL